MVFRQTYTVHEVAVILGLSTDTVYRRLEEGDIPGEKIGGTWRVPIRLFHERFPTLDPPEKSFRK